jgi:hypothetical protein
MRYRYPGTGYPFSANRIRGRIGIKIPKNNYTY